MMANVCPTLTTHGDLECANVGVPVVQMENGA